MADSPASSSPGSGFNPFDPGFLENPFPFYALGRQFRPLMFDPSRGVWSAFRYDDCAAILRDHATWSSDPGGPVDGPPPTMLGSDPPRHARLRGLVSQAFTPRMVEQLEPRIREVANELLDNVASAGTVDIVDAFTHPLPVIMIAEILGVPAADRDRFRVWSDAVVSTLGTGAAAGRTVAEDAPPELFEELREYLEAMVERRRADPRNDLISALIQARDAEDRLTSLELFQMLVLLLVAGNETTTNLISNAIIEFMNHPAELARLREQPDLLPTAIEEVMRYSSPVQATIRRATRDVELSGKSISRGQPIIVWIGSSNRDVDAFPEPDRFDIARTPNRHLGFGLGIHFCLGAPLARLEAKIALETLLARFSSFERADREPLPRVPTFIMHGVRKLPIRVTDLRPAEDLQ